MLFNFEIINAAVRDQQFENLWGVLQQLLRAGKSVLIYCMAGKRRVAGVVAIFKSLLQNISLEETEAELARVRPVEMYRLRRQNKALSNWARQTVGLRMLPPLSIPVQYIATDSSHLHLAVEGQITLYAHKQSGDKDNDCRLSI